MPSKKYYIVKDYDNQNGGYMQYKIIANEPRLILGPPVMNFTRMTPANIKIISDQPLFNMTVPLNHLRSVTDSIFNYIRRFDSTATFLNGTNNCIGDDCKNKIRFLIQTPKFNTTLVANPTVLRSVIPMLQSKYSPRGLNFYDPLGNQTQLAKIMTIVNSVEKMK